MDSILGLIVLIVVGLVLLPLVIIIWVLAFVLLGGLWETIRDERGKK